MLGSFSVTQIKWVQNVPPPHLPEEPAMVVDVLVTGLGGWGAG